MRDFEDDFDFDFPKGIIYNRPKDFRVDEHEPVTFGAMNFSTDSGRESRIQSHQKRVQKELKAQEVRVA